MFSLRKKVELGTKGAELIINEKDDFKAYFGKGTYAIIGDKDRVKINSFIFPISNSEFFKAEYSYNGKDYQHIILDSKDDYLYFDRKILLNNTTSSDSVLMKISYQFAENKAINIGEFTFCFINEQELRQDCQAILETYNFRSNSENKRKAYNEVYEYVTGVYGNIVTDVLNNWLDKNFP